MTIYQTNKNDLGAISSYSRFHGQLPDCQTHRADMGGIWGGFIPFRFWPWMKVFWVFSKNMTFGECKNTNHLEAMNFFQVHGVDLSKQ